jgi:hypothetical protein
MKRNAADELVTNPSQLKYQNNRGLSHEQTGDIGGILGILKIQEKVLAGANHYHAGPFVCPYPPD